MGSDDATGDCRMTGPNLQSGGEDLMKIVCKMTTVLASCQTNRQTDREGGREERKAETDKDRRRLAEQHNVYRACLSARESSQANMRIIYAPMEKCCAPAPPLLSVFLHTCEGRGLTASCVCTHVCLYA